MAVKIRLKRLGKIREPHYRIVVADSRTKRDGRAIEEIGRYHPKEEPSRIEVDSERVQYWLGVGAQPSEPVLAILKLTGDWQRHRGEPGAEGTLKPPAQRADRRALFEAAAKETGDGAGSGGGSRSGQGRSGQARAGHARAGQGSAGRDSAGQGSAGRDSAGQGSAGRDSAPSES